MFALGSLLFGVVTGKPPYYGLEERIPKEFGDCKFPDATDLGAMREIIMGCWQGHFSCADDILEGVQLVDSTLALRANAVQRSTAVSAQLLPLILETAIASAMLGLLIADSSSGMTAPKVEYNCSVSPLEMQPDQS